MSRDHSSGGERLRGVLGAPPGRAVDDGASRAFSRKCVFKCPMDVLDALRSGSRHHHEFQIGAFRSAVDDFEPTLQRPFEVLDDIVDDVVLGGGGQAEDGRGILSVVLGDVARDVAIVGAEIVPPLRQAVRLVHDPRADAAPRDRLPERTIAKLLRSDQDDSGVAETDVGKRLGAFRHGNEAVDRGGAGDALAPHRRDLVGHQRHQWRNHHGERPGCCVAHQRRELITERFSGSGGKDPEHLRAGEVFLGNGALQALAVATLRPISEGWEPEPSLQRLFRVEMLRAPGAVSVSAARIAELRCQGARCKPLFDVGRNDGVPSCHRQPCQQIRECEGMRGCGVGNMGGLVRAPAFPKTVHDCRNRSSDTWRCCGAADCAEEVVEGGALDAGGEQSVPGEPQVFVGRLQCIDDVGEQLECQLGIQEGIVNLHPRQRRFLILLDEVMVGVFGECQRAEVERVDGGQVEQFEVGRMPGEEFEIVLDDVVSDQIRGACGEFVQSFQGRRQSTAVAAPGEGRGTVGTYRADRVDVLAALKVDGEQAGKLMRRQARPYTVVISPWLDCRSRIRTQHTIPLSSADGRFPYPVNDGSPEPDPALTDAAARADRGAYATTGQVSATVRQRPR